MMPRLRWHLTVAVDGTKHGERRQVFDFESDALRAYENALAVGWEARLDQVMNYHLEPLPDVLPRQREDEACVGV